MRPGFFLVFLALLGGLAAGPVLFLATPASAQPPRLPGVLPLDRILPGIRQAYPGEFYDADGPTPGPDGQEHYHLKWMTPDGRIVWLDADARTGRVLGAAPGRDVFDGPGPGRFFAPAPSFPTGPRFEGRGGRGEEDGQGFEDRRGRGDGGAFRGGGRGGYGGGRDRRGR
jgi:hypothetical protein